MRQINPYALGGAFLEYCAKKGWVVGEGEGSGVRYYVTAEGTKALAEQFDIHVEFGS